ncbi:GNAT family N-acetyltransferase [Roseococcus thiosulfatophilus]|uniref:GNAT family N-acetyltransferase n=1 Tax=Roseococcus thiosulfatophilus TaxID=35813 RepID=UPI001A8C8B15|nr:GNAT family N-acetyltransferase [Roseococcus thiosulfatophilus]
MTLRTAAPEDAALLADIHASAFPAHEAWDAKTMATLLGMPGALGLVAGEAGMVLLRLAADEAEVLTFAVRPEARRTGLGRALLETGMMLLAAQGATSLLLEVAEENTAAIALYTAAGFTRAATRRDYYGAGRHALLLRADLGA